MLEIHTCRLALQHFKLNSRIIAIIGLLITTLSCVIFTDWQSIPYDPCTELSPFHHPGIISKYKETKLSQTNNIKRDANCFELDQPKFDSVIYVSAKLDTYRIPRNTDEVKCTEVDTCSRHCNDDLDDCLWYILDKNLCIQQSTIYITAEHFLLDKTASHYLCTLAFNKSSFYSVCVTVSQKTHKLVNEFVNKSLNTVHLQALLVLEVDLYTKAVNACESANFQGHQCYWIPNSIITNKHCSDCQPICRSLQNSLTFSQFCIGAALLMVSIPVAWVPVASLISDRVHREAQVSSTHSFVQSMETDMV